MPECNNILPNQITSDKIFAGAVITANLADGAVNGAKLADGAVNGTKLVDGAITGAKLADGAVSGAKLVDGAITGAKLADGAVSGAKLAAGAVTGIKLADGTITGAKLAAGTVNEGVISDGGVTSAKLANGAVTSAKLSSDAVWNLETVQTSTVLDASKTASVIDTYTGPTNGDYSEAQGTNFFGKSGASSKCVATKFDGNGNYYVAGYMTGASNILYNRDGSASPIVVPLTSTIGHFIAKYDTSGKAVWVVVINDSTTSVEKPLGLTCDADGNIFFYGTKENTGSTVITRPATVSSNSAGSSSVSIKNGNVFVVKLDTNGEALWTNSLSMNMLEGMGAKNIACDSAGGRIYRRFH